MKARTKAEWLKWYEERTGCKDLELSEGEQVFFHPEHGFITYYMHDDILELHHMCGDGKAWQKVLVKIMEHFGLKKLRAYTRRHEEIPKHGSVNTAGIYAGGTWKRIFKSLVNSG